MEITRHKPGPTQALKDGCRLIFLPGNRQVYCIGGFLDGTTNKASKEVWCFMISQQKWIRKHDMCHARSLFALS